VVAWRDVAGQWLGAGNRLMRWLVREVGRSKSIRDAEQESGMGSSHVL
jgi:hypothetical protein